MFGPDGSPLPRQVTVTHEQVMAVFGKIISGQVGSLIQTLGIPPNLIAEELIRLTAGLLAGAQPPQVRQILTAQLMGLLQSETERGASAMALPRNIGAANGGG
jgi:hypothetical protein